MNETLDNLQLLVRYIINFDVFFQFIIQTQTLTVDYLSKILISNCIDSFTLLYRNLKKIYNSFCVYTYNSFCVYTEKNNNLCIHRNCCRFFLGFCLRRKCTNWSIRIVFFFYQLLQILSYHIQICAGQMALILSLDETAHLVSIKKALIFGNKSFVS